MNVNFAEWAQFVAIALGGAFGLFCLFDGTRRSVGGSTDGRGGRLLMLGLLIVLMLAGNAYWQYWTYADAARAYQAIQAPRELPADWGRKMTPAKREAASQNAARGAYVSSGALRQYFDISGQRKAFAPAEDDIKRRERVVVSAARLEQKADENFQAFILWLVLGASAFIFGFGFALEPAAKPVESEERIEPTAPPAPAPAPAKPAAAAAPAKPVGIDTVPLAKPVGSDTVPLPKPLVGGPKPSVGDATVPLQKPPPGAFTPPKKS